ncbi:MAG: hypothetical protein CR972_00920 [Candidatus Moraniibacteriota bacterium]|nr:MAG: hypothetical protein CR972_00920 [Candidatus Moranbacteria bacterium]
MNDIIDVSNLRKVILTSADQFSEGFAVAKGVVIDENFDKVAVSGMGGSALHIDVLLTYLKDVFAQDVESKHITFYQNRTYKLPVEAYENCLNIICSHSGNTEETITSFEEALKNNLPCVGISAGGRIEEMCKKNNVPHIKLPIPFENFQPRMATGHFVSAILQILIDTKKIPDVSKKIVDEISEEIRTDIALYEKIGREYAKKLVGKTPIIYASDTLQSIALVWKIKINENSKVPAFWNYFPELNHNEFVGFTNPQAQFSILILRDKNDHPRNIVRYDATAIALREKGLDVNIIDIVDGDMFRKLFSTIGLCDWISYYLALEYGQDPTPVDMVEDFKKAIE